jgi:peptide deformylase
MPVLPLVIAPDPVLRQKAEIIERVDDEIRQLIDDMFTTLYEEKGLGIGANMVGVLKRVIVVDLMEDGIMAPMALINPEVVWASENVSEYEEASLSFPGIAANIERPSEIRVKYLDREGEAREIEASVPLSTVIQHEMDYLDGRSFLDRLSRIKRDRLLKKMAKYKKLVANNHHHHDCGDPDCGHEH